MIEIFGKVIHGDHYGRKLGFPTANLDRRSFSRQKIKVKFGVWAGKAVVGVPNVAPAIGRHGLLYGGHWPPLQGQKSHPAAIVIGPIDKTGLPKLEAHLIGFKGNLYGKRIVLTLRTYIRPFKKYSSEKDLIDQIKQDVAAVKNMKL